MRVTLVVFILIFSTSSFTQEWYENWPASLDESTIYYRGQRTDLASFDHLLEMLTSSSSEKVITSRMFRTFQKVFPEKSIKELVALADEQREYWKGNNMLGWIADCHADPYMCHLPKIEKLMGVAFSPSNLPSHIKQQLSFEQGELQVKPQSTTASILEFFDPIVSTSYRKDIAQSFGRDKNGYDGYVLILNDRYHRNCSEKRKEKAHCFINNEEFMEELEFPMWGYVSALELDGVIIDGITIKRSGIRSIKYNDLKAKISMELIIQDKKSCHKINKIKIYSPKIQRLRKSLLSVFSCN